jgi:4-hydroxythreonine-4-phosphate dehydrogenase
MIRKLAVTPGEPSGIGADILIQSVQCGCPHELVAFADPKLLRQRADQLGLILRLREFDPHAPAQPLAEGELTVAPIELGTQVIVGQLNTHNAPYVLACLDAAIEACLNQTCNALVTGPVQKSVINDAGYNFTGHTEYLAEKTNTATVVMMLACSAMRLNKSLLTDVLEIINRDMASKFAIKNPRILVCGLNPHAGESGHLGREEIEIISPVIDALKNKGLNLIGPLAADTLFTEKYLADADAVLAMYHDQGLPVLKYAGFGQAANITLGLPIIRTSVDHGTALDLAGTGRANPSSLQSAITAAADMARLSQGNPV